MIRLFLLLGILGGGAVLYLATLGMGPEEQRPPVVSQLAKFEEEGVVPAANAVVENEELEHDIFEVPPEDEERLEAVMAESGGMAGMDMSGGDGGMDMGDGDGEMAEGEGTMEMGDGDGEMAEGEGATEMGDGDGEMAEGEGTMEMGDGDGGMEMAAEGDEEHGEEEGMGGGGLAIHPGDNEADREIELVMEEWGFSNMQIDVKVGERIRFTVKNGGKIPHEFMFMTMPAMTAVNYRATRADWNLLEHEAAFEQSIVLPGGEFTYVVEIEQPGAWMFMCMLPYHMQMGMMGQMATEGMAMQMEM